MKRTLFDRLANAFGYVKAVSLSTLGSLNMPAWAYKKTSDYLESYKSWVYGCVKARSTDTSSIKLHLFKVINREKNEVEEVYDHEVVSLLRSVNPWMTFRQLIEYTQAYKDLAGEAFWYLERSGKNGAGKITQIWLLRPDWMTIKTSTQNFIDGYEYRVPGQKPIALSVDQIIHHKEFNPTDPYRGMSIVRAAATTIDAEMYAEQYNKKFFENSAIPSVVLSSEQKLDVDIIKRMREQWMNEYGGPEKAHKLAILEGGLKVTPYAMSQKDMEFIVGQQFSRDKILALFQTPKTVLGMTEDVTVSNAEATDYVFSKRVVKPLMEKLRDTLNEFLLPMYDDGEEMFFTFEDPVPENKVTKMEQLKAAFGMGAMTPNEVRHELGLDEVDGLDNFYLPLNVIPVTGDGQNGEDEPVKGMSAKANAKKKIEIPAMGLATRFKKKLTKDITAVITKELFGAMKKDNENQQDAEIQPSSMTKEQQEGIWKMFVEKSAGFENHFKEKLISIFNRQEEETIKRLNNTQKALSTDQAKRVLFDLNTENKIAAEILLPVLREFMEDAGNDALDLLGLNEQVFDTTTATVQAFFAKEAVKDIKSMNKTTRAKLRRVLSQSVADGDGIPAITSKIQDVFKEATKSRAETIARTEVIKAGNRGALEAYKQSGVVVGKQWFTALDERVCEFCGPMHGRIKALDNNFFHQGESFTGNEGGQIDLGYASVGEPPLHPNCRCTVIPITRR